MANGNNGKNGDGAKFSAVLVAIVGAAIGSSGTVAVYLGTPFGEQATRPDPYTGTQGAAIEQRVYDLERRVDKLPPRELEFAVRQLRVDVDNIQERLDRLEDKAN